MRVSLSPLPCWLTTLGPAVQVLRNPKQKRFFKSKDIHDLFTLGDQYTGGSETAHIFSSLHGGLEVPLDPDTMAVPVESAQAPGQRMTIPLSHSFTCTSGAAAGLDSCSTFVFGSTVQGLQAGDL